MLISPARRRFALAGLLAAFVTFTLIATAPTGAAQMADPPNLYFGNVADITVDGAPYDNQTPIETLDETGAVVAVANVEEGIWLVQVDDAESVSFRIGAAVSGSFPFTSGQLTEVVLTVVTPDPVPQIELSLDAGFQALTHVGGDLVVADFLTLFDDPDAIAGIFVWNTDAQGYTVWRLGLPDSLQDLTEIGQNTPMLLLLESPATYVSDVLPTDAGSWALDGGFTGIAYLGGGDGIDAALDEVTPRGAIVSVFRFDNGVQNWDSFSPELPLSLNSLQELQRGNFLLVLAEASATWSYPDFPSP